MERMTELLFALSGLLFGLAFLGGYYLYAIPFGIISLVLAYLNRTGSGSDHRKKMTEKIERIVRTTATQTPESRTSFQMEIEDYNIPKIQEFSKSMILQVEQDVDTLLQNGCNLLKRLMPGVHSVAVFFPMGKGLMQLRLIISDCTEVAVNGIIKEGQGLIGQLLKPDFTRILEGDLSDTHHLFLYVKEVPVRSVAGVPILYRQKKHGAIVVDSLTAHNFDEASVALLKNFAELIGQMCYTTSVNFNESREKAQFYALFKAQEQFIRTRSAKEIYERVQDAVKTSLPFERLMILAPSPHSPERGRVVSCIGKDEEYFLNVDFSLNDKGLLLLCFQKRMSVTRTFAPDEYVYRINAKEKPTTGFRSLLAVPVNLDNESAAVGMVICLESLTPNRYAGIQKDLLQGICSAAGLALEKTLAYEEKQEQASKDGLTGLINHRTFQEKLKTENLRAKRMNSSLGIMMMDIDKFKLVNDHYGHPAGDKVLKQTAVILRREIRTDVDVVARYGGEEFVVMIVDATDQILKEAGERIRAAVESQHFEIGRVDPLRVTLSIGYYLLKPQETDVSRALKHADEALYRAKESGRNRVVAYK
jgi:diguanylate cyclase (GGDEF)-like protein